MAVIESLDLSSDLKISKYTASAGWVTEDYTEAEIETSENGEYYADRLCVELPINKNVWETVTRLTMTLPGSKKTSRTPLPHYRIYAFDPTIYPSIPVGEMKSGSVTLESGGTINVDASGLSVSGEKIYVLITLQYEVAGHGLRLGYFSNMEIELYGSYQPVAYGKSSSVCSTGDYPNQKIWITNRKPGNYTIRVKYGSTVLTSGTVTVPRHSTVSGIFSFTCVKSWFTSAGVTTLSRIQLTVETVSQSGTTTFYLDAGSDMKPAVETPTVSCVQQTPYPSRYPNTFLKEISKAKVAVSVSSGSNATISSVTCTVGGSDPFSLTYNSSTGKYEGTTPKAVARNDGPSVTVTDSRGLSKTKFGSNLTVYPYVRPSLNIDESKTYRCNSSGTQQEGGVYYRAKATATYYSGLNNNRIVTLTVKEIRASSATSLTSGTQSSAIATSASYDMPLSLTFFVEDYVGYTYQKTIILDAAKAWIHWRTPTDGNGISLGIGKYADTPVSGYSFTDLNVNDGRNPALLGYLLEGMNAGAFPMTIDGSTAGASFGKNFLSVDKTKLISQENASAWFSKPANNNTWSNVPSARQSSSWNGIRLVFPSSSLGTLIVIIETSPQLGTLWFNFVSTGGTASGWKHTEVSN